MQTTHMATPVLEVAHLEKVYGALGNVTRALNDANFTVNRGEFVGIMGASGSGKSTLLNCVSTIDSATSGTIRINGQDVTRMKQAKLPPMRFESTDGYPIYVGRNNRQNDELTFRLARKDDIWCHASKVHGSHVIISCGGTTPPDDTVTQAAQLAAYYAETGGGQNIPVDVTAVKQVKKIPNGKPGMVIYHTYRTVIANPYPDIVVDALNAETRE